MMVGTDILPGQAAPLGATVYPDGVNFSLYSFNATAVELLLFDSPEASIPARIIVLNPEENHTVYYWHVFVKGLKAGQLYAYRVFGPFRPELGLRFDGSKVLIDPYTRAVMYNGNYDREAARRPGDNGLQAMKSVVVDNSTYDWEGDTPIKGQFSNLIIYEMHVRGFTYHPSSGVAPHKRGTYAGLIEKIPYLKELGVTAVELMPVQQFDPQDAPPPMPNYWGYQPIAFFAPHRDFSSRRDVLGPVDEFRDMVKALHRAGISVILDVVFNHTAEGNHIGPTLSFRGIDNPTYYMLEPDRQYYANYSGTGNTFNGNQTVVRRLIIECLRYWVQEMHIDGFRFDLASVLSRDEDGRILEDPPILWEIETDPVLAHTKIIAEAWDAAGLYQVGTFIGNRWAEWNGKYRDDVRRFVRSDAGLVSSLSSYISGSPNIYTQSGRDPHRSINFITAHDGFTLNDLVSYNEKHNEANGEANRDGANANFSWNCGIEGPSTDPAVEALRERQIRNLLTILMTSQGTPMLVMGDEVRRTQLGNNNAYCQDNAISWFDWSLVEQHAGLLRFVQELLAFHQEHQVFRARQFWTEPGGPEISWHGVHLGQPDWSHYSHSLAYELTYPAADEHLHVMLNAFWEPLCFDMLYAPQGKHWLRIVDTSLPAPHDIQREGVPLNQPQRSYLVQPRSAVILKLK